MPLSPSGSFSGDSATTDLDNFEGPGVEPFAIERRLDAPDWSRGEGTLSKSTPDTRRREDDPTRFGPSGVAARRELVKNSIGLLGLPVDRIMFRSSRNVARR